MSYGGFPANGRKNFRDPDRGRDQEQAMRSEGLKATWTVKSCFLDEQYVVDLDEKV